MSLAAEQEDRDNHLLIWTLQIGVGVEQSKIAREPWSQVRAESDRAARELKANVPHLTEVILEKAKGRPERSAAIAKLVREVALGSFQPGGVRVHGQNFAKVHPGMETT